MSISRYCGLLLPVLIFLVAAMPVHEEPSGAAARDLERNRQLLQKWKSDPEHYERLQQDLRAFWSLPETKRQRLRQLDRELYDLDAKTQKRLWKAAERYRAWLDRLPDEDRRKIEETSDREERLRNIKEVRERQWVERLPRKVRENVESLSGEERSAQINRLREQERQRRKVWERPLEPAQRPGKSRTQLQELPEEVQTFWTQKILTRLSIEERAEYEKAKGRAEFVPTLKRLAEQHPVLPPLPAPRRAILRYEDLPDAGKRIAGAKPLWERRVDIWTKLQQVEGLWPEWAEAFLRVLTPEQRKQMPPLGASRPREFPPELQKFIETTLKNKLRQAEWRKLRETEGKWPEYPKRLLELAHKHNLEVPGMSLPSFAEPGESGR